MTKGYYNAIKFENATFIKNEITFCDIDFINDNFLINYFDINGSRHYKIFASRDIDHDNKIRLTTDEIIETALGFKITVKTNTGLFILHTSIKHKAVVV